MLQRKTEKENNNRNNMNCVLLSDSEKMFQINSTANDHTCKLNNRQRLINRAKTKSLRISVAIVAAFIICWTPYYVSMLIFMFTNPDERVINNKMKSKVHFMIIDQLIYIFFLKIVWRWFDVSNIFLWNVKQCHKSNNLWCIFIGTTSKAETETE